jgi:uncharacterized protein
MLYRRFGRTNLAMPVFSCGGMRYQQAWKDLNLSEIAADNQANLAKTIHRAVDLGITHIETARGYGSSELQLGQVLPHLPRERLIVQTKVVPTADAQSFLKTFETSMSNLKLEYVDLLGIHGINTLEILDWVIRPGGCLDIAHRLQAQGRVRHIGFSTHGPTDVIVQAIETGAFDYVNLHWYYIFQANWPAIEAAARQDMGVFIISPSDKGGHLHSPTDTLVELCQPLSPMAFNDLFCLSHAQVHTLSLGAARPTDFDAHLQALPLIEQPEPVLSEILQRLERHAIAKLGETWYHTWQINVPLMLSLGNLLDAYDMLGFAQARYNLLGNGGHWFPGQKADRLKEFDLSACLANSPHADIIPQRLAYIHERLSGTAVKRLSNT